MKPETLNRIWFGNDPLAGAVRTALIPAELLFRGASRARNMLYDAGMLRTEKSVIPVLSVGNLTVGGTGKTPVAAWLCEALSSAGATPAVVLRGYGTDELLVHGILNPSAIVVTGRERAQAVQAASEQGADVAVLDDAFQHRRLVRLADVVLVSADAPLDRRRMLPAGPWREPLSAIRRASMAIITRKAADEAAAHKAASMVEEVAPDVPVATAYMQLGELRALHTASTKETGTLGDRRPLSNLAGASILCVAALANPHAFVRQLQSAGAVVQNTLLYPDHHDFTPEDATAITQAAAEVELVVCSLKDAVKLAPLWPRADAKVWYVTQTVMFDSGEEHVRRLVDRVLDRRNVHNLP